MVYLIHLKEPMGSAKHSAQHYIGFTDDVDSREVRHWKGMGAKILAAARLKGIDFNVVRTWPGDKKLERKLKNRRNHKRLCPVCSPEKSCERS